MECAGWPALPYEGQLPVSHQDALLIAGNCRSLAGVTIPNSVVQIGDQTILSCSSLTNITIPNGLRSCG